MYAYISKRREWLSILGLIIGFVGAFAMLGAGQMQWPDHSRATIFGTVVFVSDGDTVVIDTGMPPAGADVLIVDGLTIQRHERVRYLGGIDTPEMWGPERGMPEDHAYDAKWANWQLVGGRQVKLEIRSDRPRDDFGRLLAYIYVQRDGEWILVNAELIRQGMGDLSPRFHLPEHRYYEYFWQMQIEALAASRGIWGRFPETLTMADLIANPVQYMEQAVTVRLTVTETRDGRRRRPGLYIHGESPAAFNFRLFIPEKRLPQFEQLGMGRGYWQEGMEMVVTGVAVWDRGLFINLESPLQLQYPHTDAYVAIRDDGAADMFACSNLEAAIRQALGRPTGPLDDDELAGIIQLTAPHSHITDLSGIEALINLQTLRLSQNLISDITPLAGLLQLAELDLGKNMIVDLSPLSGMTGLRSLDVSVNRIRDISALAELSALEDLRLNRNMIVDISSLSGLIAMRNLQLWGNDIADLTPLSGMTKLETLTLCENAIADIGALAGLTGLRDLRIARNSIDDIIALSGMVELCRLDLNENRIIDIAPLAGLTQLQTLGLSRNQLAGLAPLAGMVELEELFLSWTQTEDISALAGLTSLRNLSLGWNRINDLAPLAGLTKLTRLWLYWNQISDIDPLADLLELEELALRSNQVTDIAPLAALIQLEWLGLAMNQIDDVSVLSGLVHISELSLSWNQITDIAPLVANPGLSAGDTVFLGNNQLDLTPESAASIASLELQRRGVSVR